MKFFNITVLCSVCLSLATYTNVQPKIQPKIMNEDQLFATLGETYNLNIGESKVINFQKWSGVGGARSTNIKLVEGSSVALQKGGHQQDVIWSFKAIKSGVSKFEVIHESWGYGAMMKESPHKIQKKELIFNVSSAEEKIAHQAKAVMDKAAQDIKHAKELLK